MPIIKFFIYAFSILVAGYLLPGISVDTFGTAIVTAIILGIITVLVRPFLMILTLPINVLTLGLFTFVINAVVVLIADYLITGFEVSGLIPAIIFGFAVSLINGVLNLFIKD